MCKNTLSEIGKPLTEMTATDDAVKPAAAGAGSRRTSMLQPPQRRGMARAGLGRGMQSQLPRSNRPASAAAGSRGQKDVDENCKMQ